MVGRHPVFGCLLFGCSALLLGCGGDAKRQVASVERVDAGPSDVTDAAGPSLPPIDNAQGEPSNPALMPVDAGHPTQPAMRMDAEIIGCGDGKLQLGEACDDGNSIAGDGCSADCTQNEENFLCPAPGSACVSTVVCGDGRVAGNETCDDGNRNPDDGCSDQCKLTAGYACPVPGARCIAAKCGDGIMAGEEACDDAALANPDKPGDGCSDACRVEPGWVCPQPGAACRRTVCGDGKREGSEPCDDGNQWIGDGCTPFCEVEPDCKAGACRSRCGDGLLLSGDQEACDDGNSAPSDGCSADCKVESGYDCALEPGALPTQLALTVTYRDFISFPVEGFARHPDFESFTGSNVVTPGMVEPMLGMDGKPVYTGVCDDRGQPYPATPPQSGVCPWNQQTTTQTNFDQWYRDTLGFNFPKNDQLMLARDATTGLYSIALADFLPWDGDPNSWIGRGEELAVGGHNYGFTTQARHYFSYQPNAAQPQKLTFSGDDDVWVFINHKLAVDLGGLHNELSGSVTLDAATATQLGLEAGKIYQIDLFHAERRATGSHFSLTLGGFVSSSSRCHPHCGDGVMAGGEVCDDGKNDGGYGSCTADCKRAAFCGDGKLDADHEACDDGVNLSTYGAGGKAACAPGCKLSAYCGDKRIDAFAGESCDDGQNSGGYGKCAADCHLGPRCGDHVLQASAGEQCDDGNLLGGDGCSRSCQIEQPL